MWTTRPRSGLPATRATTIAATTIAAGTTGAGTTSAGTTGAAPRQAYTNVALTTTDPTYLSWNPCRRESVAVLQAR